MRRNEAERRQQTDRQSWLKLVTGDEVKNPDIRDFSHELDGTTN